MASIVSTVTGVVENALKPTSCVGLVVKAAASDLVTAAATITSGTGVPHNTNNAEPEGSLYLRIDATDGDDALYFMIAAAWVPILGATA